MYLSSLVYVSECPREYPGVPREYPVSTLAARWHVVADPCGGGRARMLAAAAPASGSLVSQLFRSFVCLFVCLFVRFLCVCLLARGRRAAFNQYASLQYRRPRRNRICRIRARCGAVQQDELADTVSTLWHPREYP